MDRELAARCLFREIISLVGMGVAQFLLRTGLEDRTLQAELAGYAEYARRVRHRLVPGVW